MKKDKEKKKGKKRCGEFGRVRLEFDFKQLRLRRSQEEQQL